MQETTQLLEENNIDKVALVRNVSFEDEIKFYKRKGGTTFVNTD